MSRDTTAVAQISDFRLQTLTLRRPFRSCTYWMTSEGTCEGRAGVTAHRELQPGRIHYRKRRTPELQPAACHVNTKRIAIRYQCCGEKFLARKGTSPSRRIAPQSYLLIQG